MTPPLDDIELETPIHMQTTAQLHQILGKLAAFSSGLIAKAERIDVQRDYAHTSPTKFRRRTRSQLGERSRLLRQQAGEVFGRMDLVTAEIEARQPAPDLWLSREARAAIAENQTAAMRDITPIPRTNNTSRFKLPESRLLSLTGLRAAV